MRPVRISEARNRTDEGHTKVNATTKTAAEEIAAAIKTAGVSMKAILAALRPARTTAKAISNQTQADNAMPGVHRVKGTKGLYLRKGDNGSGSWFYRFRLGGRRPEMGLGALADVKLADAIAKAEDLRPQIRNGVNPILARRAH
jgi:hypothetical protein